MRWDEVVLFVFDCETTGVDPRKDRVVEIAAAYVHDWKPIAHFSQRVDPGVPIPEEASAIHGIWDKDVKGKQRFSELVPRLMGHVLGKHVPVGFPAGPPILAAYNGVWFDGPIINAELRRVGQEVDVVDVNSLLDPHLWVEFHHRQHQKRSLTAMCERLRLPHRNAHSALGDVLGLVELLGTLAKAGTWPSTVEETLVEQRRLRSFLEVERAEWGHYFYRDRKDAAALRIGFGKHCGEFAEKVPPDYYAFMLKKIGKDEVPMRARKLLEAFSRTPGPK